MYEKPYSKLTFTVPQILNINIAFLEKLEEQREKWPYSNIPAEIVSTGPYFKLYTPYVQNYDEAFATLNVAISQNPALAQFLKKSLAHPALKGLTLASLLIMPVQRGMFTF